MASKTIKSISIDINGDSTGFVTALNAINTKSKETQSELRALKASLKLEWDGDKFNRAQELAKRNVEETAQKVDILKKGLAELEKQGLNNTSADVRKLQTDLQIAENYAKKAQNELAAINKMRLDNAEKQLKSMDATLDKVAKGAAIAGAALLASGTAAVKLGLDAISAADDIATTADQLGITTEQLQKYQYLAMQTDVSNESLSKAFVKLNADVGNLAIGIEDSGNKALVKLIGTVKNADGSLKGSEQVFYEVISALQGMGSEAERTGYLTQIFGEKMGKDLNPMLNMSVEELKAFEDEFYNVGYLTDDNISKLADMDNTLNETKAIIKQVGLEAGVELLPVFEEFADLVRENKDEIKDFAVDTIQNITGVIKTIYEMRGGIAAAAAIFGVLKAAIAIASVIIATRKAMEGYTLATKAAEISNKALAISTALTPWGVIIVALSAVAAGVLAYNLATGGAKTETDKLNESIKEIKESYDSAVESIDNRTTKQQAELTVAEKLIDKYDELNKKVNKTTSEKSELARIVEQINSLLPDAIGKINEETGAYETQTEALKQLIEQKRQNILESAVTSKATEIQSSILENEDSLSLAESRFKGLGKGATYEDVEKIAQAKLGTDRDRQISFTAAQYGLTRKEVEELVDSYQQIIDLKDEINRLEKRLTDLLNTTTRGERNASTDTLGAPPALYAITETEDTAKKYDEIRSRKSLELGAGIITQEEYIKALEDARIAEESYLEERSDAWLKSEAEILAGKKKIADEAAKIDKETAKTSTATMTNQTKQTKDEYGSELNDLKYRWDMDLITEAQYYDESCKLRDKYLAENSDEWKRVTAEIYKYNKSVQAAEKERQEKQAAEDKTTRLAAYADKKDDLEYYIELDMLTEAEYYEELSKLRDDYLEEDSEEWRRVTVAIYSFKREMEEKELAAQKKAAEEQLEAIEKSQAAVQKEIEDTYNAQIKHIEDALAAKKELYDEETKVIQESLKEQQAAYKAEYEAKSKQINDELELERKRINTIIAAIDEEVAARRRLRETESADDKVTAAQKALEAAQLELEYARTEYEKAELTKEVQRRQNNLDAALQDREDTLFYQQKQAEKDAAQAELNAKTETANEQKDTAQAYMNDTIAQLEAEAQARLKEIENLITTAERAAESSKASAEERRVDREAFSELLNSVYQSAVVTAANVNEVRKATENINNIVNNDVKNANVTVNTTNGVTSGQISLTVKKILDEY